MKNKTRKQMAREYGVSRKTFYTMLKETKIELPPGLITPKYQKQIYKIFGKPASQKSTGQ
jgi:DNA-binding XRE family transcriptional regulator